MQKTKKAILDGECYLQELAIQTKALKAHKKRYIFSRCDKRLDGDSGEQSWCWLCHRNDRLADIVEGK